MKKMKLVTGKVDNSSKDLEEVLGVKKANKFVKYSTREEYKAALYKMNHIELCDELMRLGGYPSCEAKICRESCLALFDKSKNPRKNTNPEYASGELEDIILEGRKSDSKKKK